MSYGVGFFRGRVKNQIRDQRWLAGSRPNGGFKEKIGI